MIQNWGIRLIGVLMLAGLVWYYGYSDSNGLSQYGMDTKHSLDSLDELDFVYNRDKSTPNIISPMISMPNKSTSVMFTSNHEGVNLSLILDGVCVDSMFRLDIVFDDQKVLHKSAHSYQSFCTEVFLFYLYRLENEKLAEKLETNRIIRMIARRKESTNIFELDSVFSTLVQKGYNFHRNLALERKNQRSN